jgi:MFS family permease
MKSIAEKIVASIPNLDRRIWILMAGRLLSQVGTGFVLFYAAIVFVNQVGLSATAVGVGLGSQSISGVVGRILGGSLSDAPHWGRRKVLLFSAAISALSDVLLTISNDFPTFLAGNLLMGLGIGLYWPATEAVVADVTTIDQRNEAYALTRLADNIGLGLGVILGGWIIAATGAFRLLFVIDGISFLVFFAIIYSAIGETLIRSETQQPMLHGWMTALRDRPLLIFSLVNSLFTTYLALINSALPIYFNNHISMLPSGEGFGPTLLSALFTWYVTLTVLCQLPIARFLKRFSNPHALSFSALGWGLSFALVWVTGVAAMGHILWASLALGMMALATAAYNPPAASLVVGLAPESMRGVYLSINSLCWAVGYFIGPTIGGWAMDQPRWLADGFWMVSALSVAIVVAVLQYLDRLVQRRRPFQ